MEFGMRGDFCLILFKTRKAKVFLLCDMNYDEMILRGNDFYEIYLTNEIRMCKSPNTVK